MLLQHVINIKTTKQYILYSFFIQSPQNLGCILHLQYSGVRTGDSSRAQWPQVAGGYRSGR